LLVYVVAWLAVLGAVVAATRSSSPHDAGPLPVLRGEHQASHVDPLLTRVTSTFVHRSVEVRCWSTADWRRRAREVRAFTGGRVRVEDPWTAYISRDHRRLNLGPRVCGQLAAMAYAHDYPDGATAEWWQAWSLGLFAHVLEQLRGVRNAAHAECYAVQRIGDVARSLRLPLWLAVRRASVYWYEIYPRRTAEFRSPECRPGGRLDLSRAGAPWR